MLCENCRTNEVNFKYTEIINGKKNQIALCDKCAKKLGLKSLDKAFVCSLDMPYPSDINNLFNLLLEDNILDNFEQTNNLFNNLLEESYRDIEKQEVLKDIENAINKHKAKTKIENKQEKIKKLQQNLEKAISEERYEDAAKIRDEIKKYQL